MNPQDLTPEEREYVEATAAMMTAEGKYGEISKRHENLRRQIADRQEARRGWLKHKACDLAGEYGRGGPFSPVPPAPPSCDDLVSELVSLEAVLKQLKHDFSQACNRWRAACLAVGIDSDR